MSTRVALEFIRILLAETAGGAASRFILCSKGPGFGTEPIWALGPYRPVTTQNTEIQIELRSGEKSTWYESTTQDTNQKQNPTSGSLLVENNTKTAESERE